MFTSRLIGKRILWATHHFISDQVIGLRPPGSVCPIWTFLALLLSPAYFCSTNLTLCVALLSFALFHLYSLALFPVSTKTPFVLAQPGLAGLR